MEEETIEDVKAAYALLHRDMSALRVKADALAAALNRMLGKAYKQNWNDNYPDELAQAEAAIANYTEA